MFKTLKRSVLVCVIPVLSSSLLITSAYATCYVDYKNSSENTWNITLKNLEGDTAHIYCPNKTLGYKESCTFPVNPGDSVSVGFSHTAGMIKAYISFSSTINGHSESLNDLLVEAIDDHCPEIYYNDSVPYGITLNKPSIGNVIFAPYSENESTLNKFSKINFEADTNKKFS
ncbi:hypothetical protein Psal006b_03679 (plasmid) [Piscirickettsia salmonis]|uniref:Peptide ABC transporter substrate-binding protein n=1 Tax=Piscirickettsia salmonis TaxID=1238 RepID=A0A1L6TIJ0_PISSA|nr:hypothetical protein [Piscirickettsia salmonis]ALB24740.1 peptide ABC transporter substrate-binding protein [Piscirickettsia salmonis]ALT18913.1 hypothetical protein PSLF89_08750 [Piscirickettsia salmonis LF-89 = ATCC VR-1361]ALY04586.1 hypothetical protein AWE47_16890 [Piscirickettsia salmonis]AMA44015.1 hypothetical protein AWJ11_16670 [Piscirickettsia salmonis]AOS36910.1 hypothetical protein AVM72_16215 [Piscirickettsia salmonis]